MWLTFFKKCKPVQNLFFTLFAAFFVPSGYIYLRYGSARHLGNIGYNWSCIANAYGIGIWDARAYNLRFRVDTIEPSYDLDHRWNAFPVRCLVY